MSYYIYGFRVRDDVECRYIGLTSRSPETRLDWFASHAKRMVQWKNEPEGFHKWLVDNADNIEAFKISKVETRKEAHAMERAIIALVLQLNHRLFNTWLVPAEKRIGWKPSRFYRRKVAA